MRITDCSVHPVRVTMPEESVTGTHVVLRLRTDEGIEGVSYVSRLGGGTIKPLALLIEAAVEAVRGADPLATEALYEQLFRAGVGGPRSGLEARAASAVDAAAWDIKGKAVGQPVYRLLGGYRDRMPVSANWRVQAGPKPDELAASARGLLERGFGGLKFQLGFLEREAALGHTRLIREIVGRDIKLIVDANQRWTVKQAISMGEALAEFDPYWIEDPVVATDLAGLRQVREALGISICAGEVFQHPSQFRRLFEVGGSDVCMIDLDLGLTGFVKVAHMAEVHGLPVVNHLASEILAHGMAAVPNGYIIGFYPWAQPLFVHEARIDNGELVMPDTPGLGLELDEDALQRFAI
jgi:L-alanine-DL-glutamate epimerase-like enolase superfamily enzyme